MRALLLAGVVAAGWAGVARASVYTFTFTSPTAIGSGTITTASTLDSAGGYDVTGISGTIGGATITGLIANPNQPLFSYKGEFAVGAGTNGFYYDNLLFPYTAPFFDQRGILVSTSARDYNFYYQTGAYHFDTTTTAGYVNNTGTATLSPVPEPASLALLGMGMAGVAAVRRRRAG